MVMVEGSGRFVWRLRKPAREVLLKTVVLKEIRSRLTFIGAIKKGAFAPFFIYSNFTLRLGLSAKTHKSK